MASDRALAVKYRHLTSLLTTPGVVGVGIGNNHQHGEHILLYLEYEGATVPHELEGFRIIPHISGKFRANSQIIPQPRTHTSLTVDEWRPAPAGVSMGSSRLQGTGTLGCKVYASSAEGYFPFALSCNHVLANMWGLPGQQASFGYNPDPILQPGNIDPGLSNMPVWGYLGGAQALSTTGWNTVDYAVAYPAHPEYLADEILGIGIPTGVNTPTVGMPVQKSGRTTGVTSGVITDVNLTLLVGYEVPGFYYVLNFDDCMAMSNNGQAIGGPGDSGSLIADLAIRGLGLLFAGSGTDTVACKLSNILPNLGYTLTSPSTKYTGYRGTVVTLQQNATVTPTIGGNPIIPPVAVPVNVLFNIQLPATAWNDDQGPVDLWFLAGDNTPVVHYQFPVGPAWNAFGGIGWQYVYTTQTNYYATAMLVDSHGNTYLFQSIPVPLLAPPINFPLPGPNLSGAGGLSGGSGRAPYRV